MIYLALTTPGGAIDWPSAEAQGMTLSLLQSLGTSNLDLRRKGLAEALGTLYRIQQDNAQRGLRLVCDCRRGAILRVSHAIPLSPGAPLQLSTERGMHTSACEIGLLQFEQNHQSKTQSKTVELSRLLVDILYEAGCASYPWRQDQPTELVEKWAHGRPQDVVEEIPPILAAGSRGIDPGQISVATDGWNDLRSMLQSQFDAGERNNGTRRAYWIGRIRDAKGSNLETGLGRVLKVNKDVESIGLGLDGWPYQLGIVEFIQGEDKRVSAERACIQSVFGPGMWWPIDSQLERNTLEGWIAGIRTTTLNKGPQWQMKRVGFGQTAGIELKDIDRSLAGRVNPNALLYSWVGQGAPFYWEWPWLSISAPVLGKYSDLLELASRAESDAADIA